MCPVSKYMHFPQINPGLKLETASTWPVLCMLSTIPNLFVTIMLVILPIFQKFYDKGESGAKYGGAQL